MKQVTQNYKTGKLSVEEVPMPAVKNNGIVFKTHVSLISAGTERTKVETAQMNLLEKALSRLDLVKVVMNNIKQEGTVLTLKKAFNKLDTPISLGYSAAGKITAVGDKVTNFSVGQRIACIGEGFATHAEYNAAPERWITTIPDGVSDEEAAFVGLGAIALNAVNDAHVREGEYVVVIGLGLLGQLVVQLLKAKGCHVLGIELDEEKLLLARSLGMDAGINPVTDTTEAAVHSFTQRRGADAVLITAASKNNLPLTIAGTISRDKGRVILVGGVPVNLPRNTYYEKELVFMIARGFGADLYYNLDENRWYPYNYTPRSMRQNMDDVLEFMRTKQLRIDTLISHRFHIADAEKAYTMIQKNSEKYIGIVFIYDEKTDTTTRIELPAAPQRTTKHSSPKNIFTIGFIGAGSFAQGYILPVLRNMQKQKNSTVQLKTIVTTTGMNATTIAKKFGFANASTDARAVLDDPEIACVFIMTRHNTHASFVIEALKQNKMIFVEKPLCLTPQELEQICATREPQQCVMVGFNRRFSPFIVKAKQFFAHRIGPLMMHYRVNAGMLPSNHWALDAEGGGRIVGEMCHFVDLLNFLAASKPVSLRAIGMKHGETISDENIVVTVQYADGSIGTVEYNAVGDPSFSRERLEMFGENSVVVVDNFKHGTYTRNGHVKTMKRYSRDMGHTREVLDFVNCAAEKKQSLIPFDEIVTATQMTFAIQESLRDGNSVQLT